jgi:hypothetical protein
VSVDFNALFAIGRSFLGVAWLRDELAREPSGIREVVVRYRERWRVAEWLVEEPRDGLEHIVGPGGFSLDISARAVELYHLIRFSHFTGVDEERQLLRRACFAIASMVDSPRAIYMHEMLPNGFNEGLGLDEMESKLRATFGAPSDTFAALHAAENYEAGCWYIDDFADLRGELPVARALKTRRE